jgi:hypothetical protein
MRVGILGTRGIPNQYGGFEQFAEYFSLRLAKLGIEVSVYNAHHHPNQQTEWNGVHIIHCFDPEFLMGPAGAYLYDLNCILDSRKRGFDIILQLGYATSSPWYGLIPATSGIVTNMDGLEWTRPKYPWPLKWLIRAAERRAVNHSHALVADSPLIRDYFQKRYAITPAYIPYGADILPEPDAEDLRMFDLENDRYYLAIARIQRDNHTEGIIRGYLASGSEIPLVLVGNFDNRYGKMLKKRYPVENIRYVGTIFHTGQLHALRHFARLYFHGHSAGGTNPSLLEAMASRALICAHDNRFNRLVLGSDAHYFSDDRQLSDIILSDPRKSDYQRWLLFNEEKIRIEYPWDRVTDSYLDLFRKVLG